MARVQFSLSRMLAGTAMVAGVAALFVWLPEPFALLTLCLVNLAAAVRSYVAKRADIANLALITAALIFATLFFTDWGLSSPSGRVRIAWPFLGAAILLQLWAFLTWLSLPPQS